MRTRHRRQAETSAHQLELWPAEDPTGSRAGPANDNGRASKDVSPAMRKLTRIEVDRAAELSRGLAAKSVLTLADCYARCGDAYRE